MLDKSPLRPSIRQLRSPSRTRSVRLLVKFGLREYSLGMTADRSSGSSLHDDNLSRSK